MRFSLFALALIAFASCRQKDNDTGTVAYPVGNAADWLNGDENFDVRHYKGGKSKDSASTLFTLYNDLNNDAVTDTVKVVTYPAQHRTVVYFSCFKSLELNQDMEEMQVTDAGDLNGDGLHEIMLLLQGSESCWDNLKLYSINAGNWVEKYSGMTYQCIEKPKYSFTKLNDKTIQIYTFGESRDSIDTVSGDTLEQVLPNEQRVHIIKW